jgi:hypothetical protein
MRQLPPASSRNSDQPEPWTRPDRINRWGVIIALVSLVVGVGVPWAVRGYQHFFEEPYATIDSPTSGQVFVTNRISANGTAGHISADSDLWLTASGPSDQIYPIAELQVNAGQWSATEKQVCIRIGPQLQRIDVWISPDTADGAFVAYQQKRNSFGFNSVPSGFTKLYQVDIHVKHPLKNC